MEGLILGTELSDDYRQVCSFKTSTEEPESMTFGVEALSTRIPTVLCKKKGEDTWLIGEEAYRVALLGNGTMVDKLIKLVGKDGCATIEGVCYSAEDLLNKYMQRLMTLVKEKKSGQEIISLVVTVQTLEGKFLDALIRSTEFCGISRDMVHVLSHTETYIYYVINQKKELWANQTALFDLTEDGFHYYEMRTLRGRKPQLIEAKHEKLEEGFSLEVLETPSGEKLGDTILTACADRLFAKKLFSSVFLTGKGFQETAWASGFLKLICNKRRVFASPQIFSAGAAYAAYDLMQEVSDQSFDFSCEGRIPSTVSLHALCDGRRERVILASAGTNWYEAKTRAEFILDDVDSLELMLTPAGGARTEKINISLDELPARPNKTTRIEVILSFTSERCMTIRILDKGFGAIFPAVGTMIRRDFYLS